MTDTFAIFEEYDQDIEADGKKGIEAHSKLTALAPFAVFSRDPTNPLVLIVQRLNLLSKTYSRVVSLPISISSSTTNSSKRTLSNPCERKMERICDFSRSSRCFSEGNEYQMQYTL
jgi:hypothetical protein